ncbi:MAG: hypothetical protein ABIK73_06630 [candidate division WOR-3 bacterium]
MTNNRLIMLMLPVVKDYVRRINSVPLKKGKFEKVEVVDKYKIRVRIGQRDKAPWVVATLRLPTGKCSLVYLGYDVACDMYFLAKKFRNSKNGLLTFLDEQGKIIERKRI